MITPTLNPQPALAYFALVDVETKKVIDTISIPQDHAPDGPEYINKTLKIPGMWVEYFPGSTDEKKNNVGIGGTYDETRDAFIPPKIFASWTLNPVTFLWEPPIPRPGPTYEWKEDTKSWYNPYQT